MSDNTEALPAPDDETWGVGECLRLADLWTVGDLENQPQWKIVLAVLARETRAALAQQAATPKDHEIAAAVNALLVVVGEFHGHDSLRERLARIAVPLMKRAARQAATPPSESADAEALPEPEGWLYDWTHSSALGRPDEHFTGFSKDRAYANDKSKSHENPRRVYTADQMRAAIAAARQAATPAPAEPVYQLRAPLSEGDGWSNWYEADKEAFDRYRNDPAYKARVLYAAPPATPAPADEREAFEAWFSGEQGKPYYDMWAFAWDAWQARAALEGQG